MCGDKSLKENGVLDAEGNQSGDLGNVDKRDTENIHKMKGKNQWRGKHWRQRMYQL